MQQYGMEFNPANSSDALVSCTLISGPLPLYLRGLNLVPGYERTLDNRLRADPPNKVEKCASHMLHGVAGTLQRSNRYFMLRHTLVGDW